jgi:peptidylprolyl isomerase
MLRSIAALTALVLAAGAVAQDQQPTPPPPEPTLIEAPASTVAFMDAEATRVAQMLTGTWRSTAPVDDTGARVVLAVAPVMVEGHGGVLYAEMSRSDDVANPYRQVLMKLYRFEGALRLRTLEFEGPDAGVLLAGSAYVPDLFPASVTAAGTYPTLDIQLTPDGNGFTGTTPYAYPTEVSGAVQMTSTISIAAERLITGDTGFGADGAVVWGGESDALTFERASDLVKVNRWSNGLVEIRFAEGEGDPVADGDFLAVHYTGRLANGSKFDSSRDRGEPFRYRVPGRLIEGWVRGTAELRKGAQRRLIIPPELGYGAQANARIPANSTLVFDIECVFIERAEQPGENPDEAASVEPAAE